MADSFHDLFAKNALAHRATVMANGSPRVTPGRCSYDGLMFGSIR